ncbi:hypothetical protein ACF3M1_01360 [Luteimonas sp. WGS1318]|uniref:hypothetical protein n=1 Tax=Luteimonas sp. WGS1318 TaxID=3366815 RepID=UPI00372D5A7A
MSAYIFSVFIYVLGFIGLASIGLFPLRAWQVLRIFFRRDPSHTPGKALAALAMLVVAAVFLVNVQVVLRIFRCLTQTYCGPSIGSGWTYLGVLGAVYLAFELIAFLMKKLSRAKKKGQSAISGREVPD